MAISKNALIHAVYDELKGKMSKEDATYAARRIVEICRPDANNMGEPEEAASELDPKSLAVAMASIGIKGE